MTDNAHQGTPLQWSQAPSILGGIPVYVAYGRHRNYSITQLDERRWYVVAGGQPMATDHHENGETLPSLEAAQEWAQRFEDRTTTAPALHKLRAATAYRRALELTLCARESDAKRAAELVDELTDAESAALLDALDRMLGMLVGRGAAIPAQAAADGPIALAWLVSELYSGDNDNLRLSIDNAAGREELWRIDVNLGGDVR